MGAQIGQPSRVGDVGFAARHRLSLPRVNQNQLQVVFLPTSSRTVSNTPRSTRSPPPPPWQPPGGPVTPESGLSSPPTWSPHCWSDAAPILGCGHKPSHPSWTHRSPHTADTAPPSPTHPFPGSGRAHDLEAHKGRLGEEKLIKEILIRGLTGTSRPFFQRQRRRSSTTMLCDGQPRTIGHRGSPRHTQHARSSTQPPRNRPDPN